MPFLAALVPATAGATAGATAAASGAATALTATGMIAPEAAMAATASAIPSMAGASTIAGIGSWLSPIMTVASVADMGMDMLGKIGAGQSEAEMLRANAEASRREAKSIQEQAKSETLRLSRERRQMLGTQAAIIGASGVDFSGSPLDVMAQTARNYEEDIMNLGYAGDVKAAAKMNEANMYDWAAPLRSQAGMIGAGGTLLSGFGQLARAKKYGLPYFY